MRGAVHQALKISCSEPFWRGVVLAHHKSLCKCTTVSEQHSSQCLAALTDAQAQCSLRDRLKLGRSMSYYFGTLKIVLLHNRRTARIKIQVEPVTCPCLLRLGFSYACMLTYSSYHDIMHVHNDADLPMLEFLLLLGFATVTSGKNTFSCRATCRSAAAAVNID